ncbi:MAG: hypothetical protein JF603_05385 [Acidobacteria bacterium]|nr:hypothetical protein [Acidobacteriota bacterium]
MTDDVDATLDAGEGPDPSMDAFSRLVRIGGGVMFRVEIGCDSPFQTVDGGGLDYSIFGQRITPDPRDRLIGWCRAFWDVVDMESTEAAGHLAEGRSIFQEAGQALGDRYDLYWGNENDQWGDE